jgi:hypothetical protein
MLPNVLIALVQTAVIFGVSMFILPIFGIERLTLGPNAWVILPITLLLALAPTGFGIFIAGLAGAIVGTALAGGQSVPSGVAGASGPAVGLIGWEGSTT